MKWVMCASCVFLSVVTVTEVFDCTGVTWRDWLALLLNAAWWQSLAIYAWGYWTAVEDRDRS